MKNKRVSLEHAVQQVESGMRLLVGGFLTVGTAERLVDALLTTGVKNLELVCSDTGYPDRGVGKLVTAGMIAKVYASHVGTNRETGKLYHQGDMEVEFVPQGTLAERIRAAGAGLGGVLTPTGVGTPVAEGKQTLTLEGKEYLIELPLPGDVAFVKAHRADLFGNLQYRAAAANFNPLIATAARTTIAEVEELVEALDPNHVDTPGVYVDYLVGGGPNG